MYFYYTYFGLRYCNLTNNFLYFYKKFFYFENPGIERTLISVVTFGLYGRYNKIDYSNNSVLQTLYILYIIYIYDLYVYTILCIQRCIVYIDIYIRQLRF